MRRSDGKHIGRKLEGTDFGRYRVGRKIGEGGYAWVYRATEVELERDCALKILLPRDGRYPEQLRERFQREAKLVGKLRDPRSIRLYEADERDGLLYMVFEYVEGRELSEVVAQEGALKPLRVAKILEQVLMALQDAHDLGIVHRDMKPGNVILYEIAGRQDQVKVLDFGIGKFVNRQTIMDLTTEGTLMGTPRYMAPEQVKGKDATEQSDIYSTGLVGYELLTGEKAVQADNPLDLMAEIADESDIRIPDDVEVPKGFRDILHKMMRKDREERYQRTGDVLRDLKVLRREGDTGDIEKVSPTASWVGRGLRGVKKVASGGAGNALVVMGMASIVGLAGFFIFGGDRGKSVDSEQRAEELAAAMVVEEGASETAADVVENETEVRAEVGEEDDDVGVEEEEVERVVEETSEVREPERDSESDLRAVEMENEGGDEEAPEVEPEGDPATAMDNEASGAEVEEPVVEPEPVEEESPEEDSATPEPVEEETDVEEAEENAKEEEPGEAGSPIWTVD